MGLHFSGHAVECSKEILGHDTAKKDTHCLVFEKIDG